MLAGSSYFQAPPKCLIICEAFHGLYDDLHMLQADL